jgi:ABC-type Fe3+ transport system substrate-binding protein
MLKKLLLGAALTFILPLAAQAQDQWKDLTARIKGQTINAVVAGEEAYVLVLGEFAKKYGIDVQPTVSRPSVALSRIQTEQKNGQFVWDIWMGGTSNMVNEGVPAGLFEPMEQFFILPEVKDVSNWRHPDFLFGDHLREVFMFSNKLEFYVLRNSKVEPEAKFETWDDLLNPKFKGKIAMRDASVPNAGTFALATAYGVKGADYLRKLLAQDVKIFNNPQQLEQAIFRGGQAVSIGLETFVYDKCRADGGCKDVEMKWDFGAAISLGMSIPKNPPHRDVMIAFVNWVLSKEGQDSWVTAWAKTNASGAVSMRKDVPPAPGHEQSLPDFSKPENYVFVSSERGTEEIRDTIKIFKEATGH